MKDQTHQRAVAIVEFYLKAKDRFILVKNSVTFSQSFIKENKLDKRFCGHSYDIWTDKEIIEIDDYGRHSKKGQKINDGVATEFAINHLPQWKFYRLQKEEIVDSKGYLQPTAAQYLKENLF